MPSRRSSSRNPKHPAERAKRVVARSKKKAARSSKKSAKKAATRGGKPSASSTKKSTGKATGRSTGKPTGNRPGTKKAEAKTAAAGTRSPAARRRSQEALAASHKHEGFVPPEFRDSERGVRLQKAMAELGVASRRHCETLITEGHVKVNGKLVNALPAWVDPHQDEIRLDGIELNFAGKLPGEGKGKFKGRGNGAERKVYVILHKPRNVLTTMDDPQGRKHVADLVRLPETMPQRIFPVGRLDADSTGLLLMTNDGDLANRLTHPSYEVSKTYKVSVKGKVTEDDRQRLEDGLILATPREGKTNVRKAVMSEVKLGGFQRDRERGDRTTLYVTLTEGQNREIRRMFAQLGFKVRRLQRVAIGPIKLKGLASGEWRMLNTREMRALKRAAKGG